MLPFDIAIDIAIQCCQSILSVNVAIDIVSQCCHSILSVNVAIQYCQSILPLILPFYFLPLILLFCLLPFDIAIKYRNFFCLSELQLILPFSTATLFDIQYRNYFLPFNTVF